MRACFFLQKNKIFLNRSRSRLAGTEVGENEVLLLNQDRDSVWGDENVLEMDSGDGCQHCECT